MHKKLAIGLAVSLCIQGVVAEEESPWKGEGELGFTQTSGNTETQSLVTKLAVGYKLSLWEHTLNLNALRAEDDTELTAESYGLKLQSNYDLAKNKYLFGKFRYEEDRFSSYDYQSSLIFGYGHRVFDTEKTSLMLEAGVGMGKHQTEIFDDSDNQAVGHLELKYRLKVGTHSEFTQNLKVEGGSENVYSESNTGFKVSVSEKVALKLSLLVKNNSEVHLETENTDTVTAVTLVYGF
jgi:putative salt-induced outer membrane protein